MIQGNPQLVRSIVEQIRRSPDQAISFHDYMEQCLYHPEYGYYMSDRTKIGREGDFYTSSSIGTIMGEVLARYIASQAAYFGPGAALRVVEWGGGTGRLARLILDELKRLDTDLYERTAYISVEKSERHRAMQQDALTEHEGRVQWMTDEQWRSQGPWENVIILSNELLDAFPVHRIQWIGGRPYELYVEWDESGQAFAEQPFRLVEEDEPLGTYLHVQEVDFQEGQQLEVNLHALDWIRSIGAAVGRGQLITVDYGDQAEELYAEHRMKGTIIGYRSHMASEQFYSAPGWQDITSHVNFTALIRAGEHAGLRLKSCTTQKQFLLENGILQMLQDAMGADPFSEAARRNRSIRQLLLSDQMSELFKVLVQEKR
ncbi:SAM-dependent methyltransferase [Paenibacillus sp. H1-7]|uniref:class I SAM-dependent methyltransferase n=1 Tax=Paenibacillus sp. H1-7 TaxID=2282849 RepID=UPI001EF86FE4|nr:SAM-dependent methyltransferase [Paenibacillus sp. H1-7]ULL17614.1 SAM-dependent methyltransferase [Paenibacillus sp. H1-7]